MEQKDFSEKYTNDIDFHEIVDYLTCLVKVNSFFSEIEHAKLDKLKIKDVEAQAVQTVLSGIYRNHIQKYLDTKTAEVLLKYTDKLLRKELDVIQQNVHS